MAGHSKWANIKHKKAAADAVKGKVFSRIAKEIMVAARLGGGDPNGNITLRTLVQKARAVNMPTDNIDRAIKRGTGEIAGAAVEEIVYEGFAPGGVALIIQILSDNRNRTAAEIRNIFGKHGGNLAAQGSVLRSFKRKGHFVVGKDDATEDRLIEVALDAGAEDVKAEGDVFEVTCEPNQFPALTEALAAAGIKTQSAEITMLPDLYVPVTNKEQAAALLKFIGALEENDDVQNVYANFDMSDELMEAASQG
jgi:YebC/PmpR family DNA-binding regulatory protein